MTADRFVRGWVRTYTRGLPEEVRSARCAEIESDVHEHRSAGARGAAIVGRTLRGIPADLIWRREEQGAVDAINGRITGARALWAAATDSWFTPLAVLLGLFNVLGAATVLFALDDSKGAGRVVGPIILVTLAGAMFTGLLLRWRAGQPATAVDQPAASAPEPLTLRARLGRGVVALVGVTAIVLGVMGSLSLVIGGALVLTTVAVMAARRRRARAQRRLSKPATGTDHIVLADVLIIAGTLPALAIWWLIVPAVLALAVIGGVIGTGPGTRRRAAQPV